MERSIRWCVRSTKPDAKLISITANDLYLKSNYQDFQRYQPVDVAIAADAEATLPSLIEAVKRQITDDRKNTYGGSREEARDCPPAGAGPCARERDPRMNASPISTARMSAELWAQIKDEDWSLVSNCQFVSRWPLRLWDFNKHYHYIGTGRRFWSWLRVASVGRSGARQPKHGRLTVSIQNDGDAMFAPGVLWTAAHSRIPLLITRQQSRLPSGADANSNHGGPPQSRDYARQIGNVLNDPPIDYAKLAQSMGVHGEGPVTDPSDLAPAIKRAIAVVKEGKSCASGCSDAATLMRFSRG